LWLAVTKIKQLGHALLIGGCLMRVCSPLPRSGFALFAFFALMAGAAQAQTTGTTGGSQPFDNMQPSLAVTEVLLTEGLFPNLGGGGSAGGGTLGFVYNFAGNFSPGTSENALGQSLSISQNTALFSLLGTIYGGNGTTNFALPNLTGRAIVGTGTGPGLSSQIVGQSSGSATVSLTTNQLPAHHHTLTGGGATGVTGGSQPFNNVQPSLAMTRVIATQGIFPSQVGSSGPAAFIGQVATYAGDSLSLPGGWARAEGQLLSIAQNPALFSILGTTYGGNGTTTFALPDLRGRVSVGADGSHPLGMTFGAEFPSLTTSQMPAHGHTVPGGGVTGGAGGSAPVSNYQPSLALNYLIATSGIFPSRDTGEGFDPSSPILGQITEFAGNFAPSGWAFANGQLLPINVNQALFALLGTTYGGDGQSTFALPDFRGRTMIGSDYNLFPHGAMLGAESTFLTEANLAAHNHSLEPEVAAVPLGGAHPLIGIVVAGGFLVARWRRQRNAGQSADGRGSKRSRD
jgi:microcystin-dependent protein